MTLAVIAWPDTALMCPFRVEWMLSDPALLNRSQFSGAVQTAHDPFPRWMVTTTFNNEENDLQRERFAFFAKLSGRSKRVTMWQHEKPQPAGTMRGTPTLTNTAPQLAESIDITGVTGETLLPGDMLKIGNQLVTVVDGGTFSANALTVTIAPRLRQSVPLGVSVEWDKPTAQFIMTTSGVNVPFDPMMSAGFSVSFEETW